MCVFAVCREQASEGKKKVKMASDGVPGTESHPDLNSWSVPELQAKLAEIGAPLMGERDELNQPFIPFNTYTQTLAR